MFAQGQLIGMQTDLLDRLKTEINAWDKVAEQHPYSVYRRADYPAHVLKHKNDRFTTSFGDGLPYRVYSRNQRATQIEATARTMEQPYPLGYTGHVARTRQIIGQTYGRQVRDAINDVADKDDGFHSTQELAFRPPDQEVHRSYERARSSNPRPKTANAGATYATTSQLSYPPPKAECYQPPAWTERATSNIGQLDTYGHSREAQVHPSPAPRPPTALPATNSASRQPAAAAAAAVGRAGRRRPLPAAGRATRPDAWVAYKASL